MGVVSESPLTIVTPSNSQRGESWRTSISDDGSQVICTCPAMQQKFTCIHADAIRDAWRGRHSPAMTSTAVAPYAPQLPALPAQTRRPLIPDMDTLTRITVIANSLAKTSGYLIRRDLNSSPKVFAVVLAGYERDIPPMTALRHMFVVNGNVEMDGMLTMALVRRNDPTAEFKFVEPPSESGCIVELHRRGRLVSVGRWQKADSERANLLKMSKNGMPGPWQLYTPDMNLWKAVTRACRMGASDLFLLGFGVPDSDEERAELPPAAVTSLGPVKLETEVYGNEVELDEAEAPANESTYAWYDIYEQAMKSTQTMPIDVARYLACRVDELLMAIEHWLFANGEVHDLPKRVDTLMVEVARSKQS